MKSNGEDRIRFTGSTGSIGDGLSPAYWYSVARLHHFVFVGMGPGFQHPTELQTSAVEPTEITQRNEETAG